jgi:iron complex outermembrane receptor protein
MSFQKTAIFMATVSLLAPKISTAAEPSPVEFKPVTVYGAGFEEPLSQALPQTEVITSTQIQKSGLNTVGDILEKLGNLYMQQDLGVNMNASPDIRGYGATSSNNTVILLDGVKLSQNEQSAARIWSVPVEAIDHIEIIRGSTTVLFGEGATSGVINIITNKQKSDLAVASVGVGSYGTRNANAYLTKSMGDGRLSVFGKSAKSDGYRQQSNSDLSAAGFQYDHTLSANMSFGVRYGQDTDKANLPGFLSLAKYAQSPTLPQYTLAELYNNQAANTTVKNYLTSAYFKVQQGDYTYLFDVSRRDMNTDYMDTRLPNANPFLSSATDYLYQARQDAFNAKVKVNNFAVQGNVLTLGATSGKGYRDLKAWGLPTSFGLFSSGYTSISNKALFVQDDWKFTSVDRVTVGLRHEVFNQDATASVFQYGPPNTYAYQSGKSNLNAFEAQYSRDFTNQVTGYIKSGQSYRLPNVDDLNRYCADTCVQSLILQPQVNKDFEVGTVYRTDVNRGHVKFYRTNIDNEILFNKYANFQLGYNVNVPKTRRQGVEFFNAYRYSSALSITTGLDVIDATFKTDTLQSVTGLDGKRISGTPNYIVSLGWDYALNANNAVAWKTRVVGNQYSQGDSSNKFELGAYSVSDLSYRWTDKRWSVVANANNVFDKRYGASILAATTSTNYPYGVYPNWGRNYLLTLRYALQ